MKFPWRSSEGELGRRLRADRPNAPDDLIRTLAARTERLPARRPALAVAAMLTTALVVALAGFGGLSSAAQAVQGAVSTASNTLTGSTTAVTTGGTPADTQYSGFHGCTPGYWKQTQHFFAWGSIPQNTSFYAVFTVPANSGLPANLTLLDALGLNGGGVNALARHAAAAYLNSQRPGMNFPYTTSQVITMVNAAYASKNATTIENTKNLLEKA